MKKSILIFMALMLIGLLVANNATATEQKEKTETATGKVIAVDPRGDAITISAVAGGAEMVAGTIAGSETTVKVKGKKAALNDIKEGDTVTVHHMRSDDLYAKEIMKK